MKEKFLTTTQVAKLMGKNTWQIKDFYAQLKNYSASRFGMYEESEVLAKKEKYLSSLEKRKEDHREWKREHGKTLASKKAAKRGAASSDEVFAEFAATLKKLNRLYRRMEKGQK